METNTEWELQSQACRSSSSIQNMSHMLLSADVELQEAIGAVRWSQDNESIFNFLNDIPSPELTEEESLLSSFQQLEPNVHNPSYPDEVESIFNSTTVENTSSVLTDGSSIDLYVDTHSYGFDLFDCPMIQTDDETLSQPGPSHQNRISHSSSNSIDFTLDKTLPAAYETATLSRQNASSSRFRTIRPKPPQIDQEQDGMINSASQDNKKHVHKPITTGQTIKKSVPATKRCTRQRSERKVPPSDINTGRKSKERKAKPFSSYCTKFFGIPKTMKVSNQKEKLDNQPG
jgi:hypothetical protein